MGVKAKIEVLVKERGCSISLDDAEKILDDVGKAYERGMSSLEAYITNYSGNNLERQYLNEVYKYIKNRNSNPNTRLYGFDNITKEAILKKIPISTPGQ